MNLLEQLIQLDQHITLWLNNLSTPGIDPVWMLFSDSRIWFPAYGIVMGVMIWRMGWKKGLAVVLSLIVCVVLTDQLSSAIKDGLERLRPCYNSWMIDNGLRLPYGITGHLFGFFSGHASNTFGFAAASFLGFKYNDTRHSYKAYGWGVSIWAALVALSRIMIGAHFLGDILVGSLFGLAVGTAVAWTTHRVIVRAKG